MLNQFMITLKPMKTNKFWTLVHVKYFQSFKKVEPRSQRKKMRDVVPKYKNSLTKGSRFQGTSLQFRLISTPFAAKSCIFKQHSYGVSWTSVSQKCHYKNKKPIP